MPHVACEEKGHHYESVSNSDRRAIQGKDTHVTRAFVCTQCGDVIRREIVVWENFIPKPRRS